MHILLLRRTESERKDPQRRRLQRRPTAGALGPRIAGGEHVELLRSGSRELRGDVGDLESWRTFIKAESGVEIIIEM